MADENDKPNEDTPSTPPPVVHTEPPAQQQAATPPPETVTRTEFNAVLEAISNLSELVGKMVPGAVEKDSTTQKLPWTHRGGRRS